jgi:two-component system KDP operon response regulator KdpE
MGSTRPSGGRGWRRKVGVGPKDGPIFRFGDVEVDQQKRLVRKGEGEVHLTPIEYRLPSVMIPNLGRVLTHRQILREAWRPSYVDQGHYARVHMAHLQQSSKMIRHNRSIW